MPNFRKEKEEGRLVDGEAGGKEGSVREDRRFLQNPNSRQARFHLVGMGGRNFGKSVKIMGKKRSGNGIR